MTTTTKNSLISKCVTTYIDTIIYILNHTRAKENHSVSPFSLALLLLQQQKKTIDISRLRSRKNKNQKRLHCTCFCYLPSELKWWPVFWKYRWNRWTNPKSAWRNPCSPACVSRWSTAYHTKQTHTSRTDPNTNAPGTKASTRRTN